MEKYLIPIGIVWIVISVIAGLLLLLTAPDRPSGQLPVRIIQSSPETQQSAKPNTETETTVSIAPTNQPQNAEAKLLITIAN